MSGKDGDDLIGKVEEKVGWLTGDREAEAKGKLRRLAPEESDESDESEQADEPDADAADTAQKDVRATYGEYDPGVDGKPVAKDVRPRD